MIAKVNVLKKGRLRKMKMGQKYRQRNFIHNLVITYIPKFGFDILASTSLTS